MLASFLGRHKIFKKYIPICRPSNPRRTQGWGEVSPVTMVKHQVHVHPLYTRLHLSGHAGCMQCCSVVSVLSFLCQNVGTVPGLRAAGASVAQWIGPCVLWRVWTGLLGFWYFAIDPRWENVFHTLLRPTILFQLPSWILKFGGGGNISQINKPQRAFCRGWELSVETTYLHK
jgi:hypothetical protein